MVCRDLADDQSAEREFAQDVMEKLCYVAFDYVTKLTSTAETHKNKTYLPQDGNIITVEILHGAEILFQPSPTGKEASGFHDTSLQIFTKCDIYTRKELYTNAVFYDGTAMFQRIVERMTKELTDTFHDDSSSLRPAISRGEVDQGGEKKKVHNQQQVKKRAEPTAGKRKKKNVVGAGVPAPLHEERVIARAKKANLHLGFYQ